MKDVLSESSALLQERLDQSHNELSQYADKVLQYSKSLSEAEMKLSKVEVGCLQRFSHYGHEC